jgi:hypothetical protein
MFRQQALDRLSSPERLDELMHVTSPRSWLALVGLGAVLIAALIWSVFTTVSTSVPAVGVVAGGDKTGAGLAGIVFVKPTDSVSIRPGMDVTLAQTGVPGRQSSHVEGQVTSVDHLPASQSSMLRVLGSEGLVQALSAAGEVVPVHLRLSPATGQNGGSPTNGGGGSGAGAQPRLIRASITTSREPIIQMIIP